MDTDSTFRASQDNEERETTLWEQQWTRMGHSHEIAEP